MKYMKFLHMRKSSHIGLYVLIITVALIAVFVALGRNAVRTYILAGDGSQRKAQGTGSEVSVDGVRLPEGEQNRPGRLCDAIRRLDWDRINEILSSAR